MAILVVAGCSSNRNARIGASIQQNLTAKPSTSAESVPAAVDRFYKARQYEPVWVQDGDLSKVTSALGVLRSAEAHGLVASDYGEEAIASAIEVRLDKSTERLAQLDIDVTTNLLALGHDVALGRVNPLEIDPHWKKQRTPPDFVALLAQAAAGDLNTWLSSVQPKHPEYGALQQELTAIRAQGASPTDERSRLLVLNLERWRWLPDDLGAAAHPGERAGIYTWLSARAAEPVLDMKVVVGKAEANRRTPDLQRRDGHRGVQPVLERPRQHRRRRNSTGGRARSVVPRSEQHRDSASVAARGRARRARDGGLGRRGGVEATARSASGPGPGMRWVT